MDIKKIGFGCWLVFFMLLHMPYGVAQQLKTQKRIALLVSDNYSKPVADAIRLLQREPEFASRFEVINGQSGQTSIEAADIVICYVHTPQMLQRYTPQMQQVVQRGGWVYAVGSSPEADDYQKWGMRFDKTVDHYFENPSAANIKELVLLLAVRHLGAAFDTKLPQVYPEQGIVDWSTGQIYTSFAAFEDANGRKGGGLPTVGLYAFRYEFVTGQDAYLRDYARGFADAGYQVLLFYGFPLDKALNAYCTDSLGKARIDALVSFSSLPGGAPERVAESFSRLGVPVINGVTSSKSLAEWQVDKVGIAISERTMAFVRPEIMGQIQPTVVATQERYTDSAGLVFKQKIALPGRVENLVEKVKAWSQLSRLRNDEKDVTLIYYNGHPGKHNIGASYLNVLPKSMHSILQALQQNGYDLGGIPPTADEIFNDVMKGGRNIGTWAPGELTRMVQQDNPVLVPMETYRKWFAELHPQFQEQVVRKWGVPDSAHIMVWKDEQQRAFFVLPQVNFGKVHLMPQPARGWEEDSEAIFHDINLPPHHQYIAFYLYLQHQSKTHALIHLGTHGTLEWLSGREAGADNSDAADALLGGMVNIYPYIMDNVGEGTQAKRRGGAVIIDHLTPPFQEAGLRPELRQLAGVINDYTAAMDKSPVLAATHLQEVNRLAKSSNVLRDLDIVDELQHQDIQLLEHYLQELNEKQTPMGMHTFGVSPDSTQAMLTAQAMVNRQKALSDDELKLQRADYYGRLLASGPAEMQALLDGLDGKYIAPATGNDPIRNPDALPTGKNFYAFDPSRMPSPGIYEAGERLATELVESYRQKHGGRYPDKVAFNLWSVETIRHEGIMEAQLLSLLGIRPQYDGFGKVKGVERISRDHLGRPRVDVVITPSGLYRDMFPQMMQLIDQAVLLAYRSPESDNVVRQHVDSTKQQLAEIGIADSTLRERLALVRLFGSESGSYGIGVDRAVQASDKWENNTSVASVYFNRSSHLYGQGFWGVGGAELERITGKDLAVSLFQKALSGTKAVVHSRSTNVYGVLDNDDFFQYLGGMALAITQVDGVEPDILVTNLIDPNDMRQERLDKFIGRELHTRYLNPEWIKKMISEGYAGARMIGQVVDNMWGWQATTDHAIQEADWQEWHDVYIADKYALDIKERFADAGNLYAYQQMLARMLEVVRKEYWRPSDKTLQSLVTAYLETGQEMGVSCSDQVCGNEKLLKFVEQNVNTADQQRALSNLHQELGRVWNGFQNHDNAASENSRSSTSELPPTTGSAVQKQTVSTPSSTAKASRATAVENTEIPKSEQVLKGFKMEEERLISMQASPQNMPSAQHWETLVGLLMVMAMGFGWRTDDT